MDEKTKEKVVNALKTYERDPLIPSNPTETCFEVDGSGNVPPLTTVVFEVLSAIDEWILENTFQSRAGATLLKARLQAALIAHRKTQGTTVITHHGIAPLVKNYIRVTTLYLQPKPNLDDTQRAELLEAKVHLESRIT